MFCQRRFQELSQKLVEAEEIIKEKERELEHRNLEVTSLTKGLADLSDELRQTAEELALSKTLVRSLRQSQSQEDSVPNSAPKTHPIEGWFRRLLKNI